MGVYTSSVEVPRDRWGRPVLGGKVYERPSGLGGALADKSGLINWKAKVVVQGLQRKPELLVSGMDEKDIAEEAATEGGGSSAADLGTQIHEIVSNYYLTGEVLS